MRGGIIIKETIAASLLIAQLNGAPFTKMFMPELLQASSYAEQKPEEKRLTNPVPAQRRARISGLKSRLMNDGFKPSTINEIFENKDFEVYWPKPGAKTRNPEAEADAVWRKDTKEYEGRYQIYRQALGIESKIRKAHDFLEQHRTKLEDGQKKHGPDLNYIIATLAIESEFGEYVGRVPAFNSLATRYLLTRNELYYKWIKELIKFSKISNIDLFAIRGSSAGCVGLGQWSPEMLIKYFTKDGGIIRSPYHMPDAVEVTFLMFVANGWKSSGNGNNASKPEPFSANWRAIWFYNNSPSYVDAVSEIAASLNHRK